MTEPLTPEGVRALIAEAEKYAGLDEYPGALLIRDLAAALETSVSRAVSDLDGRTCSYCFKRPATAVDDDLDAICSECSEPREDVDLDAAERIAGALEEYEMEGIASEAAATMHGLIARVRTVEADRDHLAAIIERVKQWRESEYHEMHASGVGEYCAGCAQTGELEAILSASRTVETAEEWEYGIRIVLSDGSRPDRPDWFPGDSLDAVSGYCATRNRIAQKVESPWSFEVLRRRPAGPAEPVPPTPEEPKHVHEWRQYHDGYELCSPCPDGDAAEMLFRKPPTPETEEQP